MQTLFRKDSQSTNQLEHNITCGFVTEAREVLIQVFDHKVLPDFQLEFLFDQIEEVS